VSDPLVHHEIASPRERLPNRVPTAMQMGSPNGEADELMTRPTDVRIIQAFATTQHLDYRTPIKFGGQVVTSAVLLDVEVSVETGDGRKVTGHGSTPMGNIWAWPKVSSAPSALDAMVLLGQQLVDRATHLGETGHPLDLSTSIAGDRADVADVCCREVGLSESMPELAQLVAASPLDAALHDAFARALDQNAFSVVGEAFVSHDLAHYLDEEFAGEYLDRYVAKQPKSVMPLYHLVGALDPLAKSDVESPIGDGLPETLAEWIEADGLTHMKIKLNGDDLDWDVARVAAVESVAAEVEAKRGVDHWHYSLDFNERCENVDYVLEFLSRLQTRSPAALERVQYIEQPTRRDLLDRPEYRMHKAASIKPVVIDESLTDLESLRMARKLGYSGVALKACKGQSESLFMAAAAQKYEMFLCVQDLTCPGASFLHSASLAAHVPGVAAVEGNGRQYCPAGNEGWAERYPEMFDIRDGSLGTGVLNGPGLGFTWPQR